MTRYVTKLNIVFIVQLLAVVAAVLGMVPREILLFSSSILIFFILFSKIEESVLLIARSIPIFTALPIAEHFDSLNIWRIIVLIVFLKWLIQDRIIEKFFYATVRIIQKIKEGVVGGLTFAYTNWKIETLCTLLLMIAIVSITQANDTIIAIKRIIYFLNLGMLFFVVRAYASTIDRIRKVFINALIGGVIVLCVGIMQLIMAYMVHINQFAEFWALQVNQVLYGSAWAHIAISANTWFAYYNDTIHLRMFSSFPDTHSFPLYLLMIICFAVVLLRFEKRILLKRILQIITIFAISETILSGTRGIWVSILFPLLFLGYLFFKQKIERYNIKFTTTPLLLFLLLLLSSSVVFNSTQFTLQDTGIRQDVLFSRILSIVDTEETSNQGRIYIWKETIKSIIKHPYLGVGIGNFPTVLAQNPSATKAGSSAHNLYLNFFAELGIFGFIVFLWIIYILFKRGWDLFINRSSINPHNDMLSFFGLNFLIYFIWILWYSMTDVAIFDERAFLLFMIFCGTLFAIKHNETTRTTTRTS